MRGRERERERESTPFTWQIVHSISLPLSLRPIGVVVEETCGGGGHEGKNCIRDGAVLRN